MKHNLTQLRAAVLQWAGDPVGNILAPSGNYARVDQIINEVYQEAVHAVDDSSEPWNLLLETDAIDIATVSGQREYEIPSDIRQIVEIREVGGEPRSEPLRIVPWVQRNLAMGDVYVFRRGATGRWYVGSVAVPQPSWSTMRVYALPELTRLTQGNDVPTAVPFAHHEVLIYGAAMKLHVQSDSEAARNLADLFGIAFRQLREKLGVSYARHEARRLG